MEITCKNCKHIYKGHYCNNCGQPAATHKINWHYLWHEIRHSLLHFDEGIPYSVKQLFTRPGHSIREFIEGKRVRHFKPLSLVIVLATFYGLLYHYFNVNLYNDATDTTIDIAKFNEWSSKHYSWIIIITIPFFTLGTYISFRKQGYNFVEYFVFNTYKASQKLFAHIILFPLVVYYDGKPELHKIMIAIYIADLILTFWTNIQFFNKISKIKALLLSIVSQLIFWISFLLTVGLIVSLFGYN
ncbi:DUF3667 domain-containing protein [Flavobacterium sp. ENC]|uniref:DUF3667 domain-containing protein n=1 Tax=Flavobacterium sp. ENC TaxID=2897330 RepID=UPI001E34E904|nr:DUF3667 domain-containing protein [Flavobacterium sp. ENC]MCD0465465.1 DUF3667 domain-containing protein [Flavobacterium sp. ENC]